MYNHMRHVSKRYTTAAFIITLEIVFVIATLAFDCSKRLYDRGNFVFQTKSLKSQYCKVYHFHQSKIKERFFFGRIKHFLYKH